MKLLYKHGVSHSKNKSKLNRLLALHNSHYVVEQILRERAKDNPFTGALHQIGFADILKKVNEKNNIPDFNRLVELNNDRNDAEHYFNVPDGETINLYIRVVGDFLRWSYKNFFDIEYESLILEDMIYDVPIKKAMLDAKAFIEQNDLRNAILKIYEALGAFKFIWFGYLSDPRLVGHTFGGLNFTNLVADLAFKIILSEDETTLAKLMSIGTDFTTDQGNVTGIKSVYSPRVPKDKEEANNEYDEILNIILSYQDRVPSSFWRKT
jgi:hypothetical protein